MLREALTHPIAIASGGVDPGLYMITKPAPCADAVNNGDTVPVSFL